MFFFMAKLSAMKIHCHHFPNLFDEGIFFLLGLAFCGEAFGEMLIPFPASDRWGKQVPRKTHFRVLVLSSPRLEPRMAGLSSGLSTVFSQSHLFVKKI